MKRINTLIIMVLLSSIIITVNASTIDVVVKDSQIGSPVPGTTVKLKLYGSTIKTGTTDSIYGICSFIFEGDGSYDIEVTDADYFVGTGSVNVVAGQFETIQSSAIHLMYKFIGYDLSVWSNL